MAVVIDQLRASSTITQALASGARRILPCLEVAEAADRAAALRAADPGAKVLTGGERRGLLIPGFDLANSPGDYTPDRVAGATIVFTTTNGTRALRACAQHGASRILVGCLANLSAVAAALAHEPADAQIVCAGTHAQVSLEDVLAAGALTRCLVHPRSGHAFEHADDDSGRIAETLWTSASTSPAQLRDALARSLGGRNVLALGLTADLDWCSRVDALPDVLPEFDSARGEIRRDDPARA